MLRALTVGILAGAILLLTPWAASAEKHEYANGFVDETGAASAQAVTTDVGSGGLNEDAETPHHDAPRITKGQNTLSAGSSPGSQAVRQGRLSIFIPECWNGMVEKSECKAVPEEEEASAAPTASAAAPTRAEVETLVRSLVARLEVPAPAPSVGPDPSVNEWNMAVVGYPLWLWTDTPASMDSSVSGYGITITMNARRVSTSFDMGDGNKVTCARMTAYPRSVKPATPSPSCGYAYSWPSLPKGNYTVTATSRWEVAWSAVGFSGTLPLTASASRELPVGELHAVVVR